MARVRVRIIRHGKTEGTEPDRERQLSPEGREQARKLGMEWKREGFVPQVILCSTAPRAIETANIVCGVGHDGTIITHAFEELYFGKDPSWLPPIAAAFRQLGNAPLQDYESFSDAASALCAWAEAAVEVVLRHVRSGNADQDIAVFTHALFGPMLATSFLTEGPGPVYASNCPETVLSKPLQECGVIEILLQTA